MPALTVPTTRVHASFLAAMDEFIADGRGDPHSDSIVDREIRQLGSTWADPQVFADYVATLLSEKDEETPRPEGIVPATTWWWVEGQEYLGRICLRHRLTERLLNVGGHIGYDVRPSARRRGHATAMLRAVLSEAAAMGIQAALVTCDGDNVGSRCVIELNGGVLEDERDGKLRFWVPTT